MVDAFDPDRFLNAQQVNYDQILQELKAGRKRSHWMWYIFPQAEGLGQSECSKYFSLKCVKDVIDYLKHPVLGARLLHCTETVVGCKQKSAKDIFGEVDAMKFRSCITLFSLVHESNPGFHSALEKFYGGSPDGFTCRIFRGWKSFDC